MHKLTFKFEVTKMLRQGVYVSTSARTIICCHSSARPIICHSSPSAITYHSHPGPSFTATPQPGLSSAISCPRPSSATNPQPPVDNREDLPLEDEDLVPKNPEFLITFVIITFFSYLCAGSYVPYCCLFSVLSNHILNVSIGTLS